MDSERWQQIQNIFHQVADQPASEQAALLKSLCNQDTGLITDVLLLLKEDAEDSSLLDRDLPQVASELMDDSCLPLPNRKFGPYRLTRLLGEGGMGVVYLAERDDLGIQSAIKILRDASLSPARRQLFAREQKTLAQLNHSSIARLYDADALADGTPYFVMEYVEGVHLTVYCREHKSSVEEILRLFRSVCDAVQYAHRQAIIHRDIKPSNILVKDDGSIKLLDFGIARQIESLQEPDRTKTALRLMTPAYAAPEQIRGERVGTQADVYSLGVVLYELLAGRLPYDLSLKTPVDAQRTIEEHEPAPPSAIATLSDTHIRAGRSEWSELDVLCLKALHKDPRRRYQSVEALIRDIDHYLKREPLEARPDTLLYRTGRFAIRHRRGLSAAAIVLVILTGLVAFFTIRLARERARTLEEAALTQRIQRFMLSLFDGGDKDAGPSGGLRVATLLDRGVQEAHALNGEGDVQDELYLTLANIYEKVGKFDPAAPLLQSVLNDQKARFGADNPATAKTMVELGLLKADQAQLQEAEQLIRTALTIDRRHLRSDDPATATAMAALGHVLAERGAYNDAIDMLNNAVQIQSKQQVTPTDLSKSLTELAEAHYYAGHIAVADSLYHRALAIDQQSYGTTHPRVADDLVDIGEVQHDLGNNAEAEKYYRQALAIKKSWYGEIHPDTATCMDGVGQSLIYQGRYNEAAPFLQRALAIQEQIYGKMHPQVAIALNQLGVLDLRRGQMDEAEADFSRMAEINRAAYGDKHMLVGVSLLNLAEVHLEKNEYATAEKFFRESLEIFTEKLPPDHPTIAIARVKLGKTLVLEHKYSDAEQPLLLGYATLSKQNPLPVDRLQSTRKDLVTVYEALNEHDKAEQYRRTELAQSAQPGAEPHHK